MSEKYKKLKSIYKNNILQEEYIHRQSHAHIAYVNNEKDNSCSINFITPVNDDKGISHILEHCIVKGINTFYLKNSSVYFNAETFIDRTVYQFETDDCFLFMQYIEEVMKGVFFPEFYENSYIFNTEAWRIEKNIDNEYVYNGVVYNEMKNVLANPVKLFAKKVLSTLFNTRGYSKISGGIPSEIIRTNNIEIINYHKKYYKAENCFITVYSKESINKILKKLDDILSLLNKDKLIEKKENERINHGFESFSRKYSCYGDIGDNKENRYFADTFECEKAYSLTEYIIYALC